MTLPVNTVITETELEFSGLENGGFVNETVKLYGRESATLGERALRARAEMNGR